MSPEPQTLIFAGCAIAAIALWLAMSQRAMPVRLLAAAASAIGLLLVVVALQGPQGDLTQRVLFWLFAGGAIGGGVLMISGRDPVNGALWFAVATLSVCGLFNDLSAPFLAATTIIVYAGAIIVTFMFVIMLAQQGGATRYDQRPRLPLAGSLTSFFVLGALAFTLLDWHEAMRAASADAAANSGDAAAAGPELAPAAGAAQTHAASTAAPARVTSDEARQLRTLGRTLFGHYLYAVELGGTLLLIATVGAIALAPRRQRGNL